MKYLEGVGVTVLLFSSALLNFLLLWFLFSFLNLGEPIANLLSEHSIMVNPSQAQRFEQLEPQIYTIPTQLNFELDKSSQKYPRMTNPSLLR